MLILEILKYSGPVKNQVSALSSRLNQLVEQGFVRDFTTSHQNPKFQTDQILPYLRIFSEGEAVSNFSVAINDGTSPKLCVNGLEFSKCYEFNPLQVLSYIACLACPNTVLSEPIRFYGQTQPRQPKIELDPSKTILPLASKNNYPTRFRSQRV